MTRLLLLIATLGSAALMIGALGFQYIGGLAPCPMCLWQRYPHVVAIVLGVLALSGGPRILALLGGLSALTTAGIALFHTGVERAWWEGPSTCTSGAIAELSPEQLMDQIMNAPLVRCDEVAWEFLGLSMASWNGIASLVLAGVWFAAWLRG
ncbi:disulfide bond formation protein B [Halocynthiibacter sp. C4]|uniref:disulfide bond formation protein B n=1 Tax=Halocynthiibacter sp. C4 TaxID=2992758 RepID=UPI00237B07A3|nr:disulfide bond formation protein B [Halocynthiibacter sp. C4]MDE0589624.1 disulfide bond formation protein B [Halocynthiibacter sp. C4]